MRLLGREEDGFTLIELLVTMSILLVVVSTLTGALVSITNTQTDQSNRFQTQQQARMALSKLAREIHCANTIDDGAGAPLTSTPVTGLTLTLPAGCPTGGATAVTAKWCTVADGTTYDLYRTVTATCSSAGVRWATSLTSSTPFSLPAAATPGNHYPLVHIDVRVNTRAPGTVGSYELTDDVAALNSVRSASG